MDFWFFILLIILISTQLYVVKCIKNSFSSLSKDINEHNSKSLKSNAEYQVELLKIFTKEMLDLKKLFIELTFVKASSASEKQPAPLEERKTVRVMTIEQRNAASEKRRQWWANKKIKDAMHSDQIPPTA